MWQTDWHHTQTFFSINQDGCTIRIGGSSFLARHLMAFSALPEASRIISLVAPVIHSAHPVTLDTEGPCGPRTTLQGLYSFFPSPPFFLSSLSYVYFCSKNDLKPLAQHFLNAGKNVLLLSEQTEGKGRDKAAQNQSSAAWHTTPPLWGGHSVPLDPAVVVDTMADTIPLPPIQSPFEAAGTQPARTTVGFFS